jgi:hypothetical protein
MGRIDSAERCFGKMRSGRKPLRNKGKKKTRYIDGHLVFGSLGFDK